MLGSKIFTFGPKSGPAAQAGAPSTRAPATTATVKSVRRASRRELMRIPPWSTRGAAPILLARGATCRAATITLGWPGRRGTHAQEGCRPVRALVDHPRRALVSPLLGEHAAGGARVLTRSQRSAREDRDRAAGGLSDRDRHREPRLARCAHRRPRRGGRPDHRLQR